MNESHGKMLNDLSEYCRAASWQIEELKSLDERHVMVESISAVLHKADRELRGEMQRLREGRITVEISLDDARYVAVALGTISAMLSGMKTDIVDWQNDIDRRAQGREAISNMLRELAVSDTSLERLCLYYEDEDIQF